MMRRDRASAAVANALRVLPVAGEPFKQHQSPNSKTPQALAGPRFEHLVDHLHHLGPRAVGEFLIEIATTTGQSRFIAARLQAYAKLDPEIVRAVGGDRFPPMPLEMVR